jgi:hypothetical protein
MGEKIGRREVRNPSTSGAFTDVSGWSATRKQAGCAQTCQRLRTTRCTTSCKAAKNPPDKPIYRQLCAVRAAWRAFSEGGSEDQIRESATARQLEL